MVPNDVAAAAELNAGGLTVLAGGTDVYPSHVGRPMPPVVDIGGLSELRGIAAAPDPYRFGALTRWVDIVLHGLNVGIVSPGREADLFVVDAPLGSQADDALGALTIGDTPAVASAIIDRTPRYSESRDTPPPSRPIGFSS